MRCEHCSSKVKGINRHKHLLRCPRRPTLCQHCDIVVSRDVYCHSHGNFCLLRVIRCKFCHIDYMKKDLSAHLCCCDGLDQLLLEKYNLICDTSQNEQFYALLISASNVENNIKLIREFLNKNFPVETKDYILRYKLYYCSAHFEYSILSDPSDFFYVGRETANVTYKHFPIKLLPDLRFILGDRLTYSIFQNLCDVNKLYFLSDINRLPAKIYTNWELITCDVNNICYQFVSSREEAKHYFVEILKMLEDTQLNIYVCKMILEYYLCDKTAGFKKLNI